TPSQRPTVLFLCSENSARSQMAEALLKHHAGDKYAVHSAGLRPSTVNPMTVRVLKEMNLDTSACAAKDFGSFLGKAPIHYGIVVCDQAHQDCEQIFPFALQRLFWPFEDPAAFAGSQQKRLAKFREVRDDIDKRIQQWLAEVEHDKQLVG